MTDLIRSLKNLIPSLNRAGHLMRLVDAQYAVTIARAVHLIESLPDEPPCPFNCTACDDPVCHDLKRDS